MSVFSHRTSLALLLIGALLVRVGWVLHLPVDEASLRLLPDQVEYLELGKNLRSQHQLQFHDPRFNQTVWAYRTPGYPALIALCDSNIQLIRILQALLDTSTVLAGYVLAKRWLSPVACVFAAFLIAINPFLIYFTGLILSETLFIAMLAWGMALLSHARWRITMLGMLLLALSVLVRPSAIFLPTALAAFNFRRSLVMAIVMLIVLTPWAARNKSVVGSWIWTTTNGGITLYDGFNLQADGSSNQKFLDQMPELRELNEVGRSKLLIDRAREFVAGNPMAVIRLTLRKIARTWSPIPLSNEYGGRRMYVLTAAVYSVPLDLLVLWALCSGPLPRRAKVFLMIPALYFTAVHALSVGSLRYRIPAEVPMAVVAGGGFRGWRRGRGSGSREEPNLRDDDS